MPAPSAGESEPVEINTYRVVEHPNGFEPQMLYNSGKGSKEVWFSLGPTGYWLEPDAFTFGDVRCRCIFDRREDAERVVLRAKAINEEHIKREKQ